MNPFEEFANKELGIVTCPRCGELCQASEPVNEDARLLKRTKDVKVGLCANCAVADWLQQSPLAQLIGDAQKLLWEPIQVHFGELMKAGNADMDPSEINWELVVKHWDLPFPGRKKRGRK